MFGHLISAICTPFDEDNKIDFDTFLKLLKKVEENHTTVLIGGSTGEGHSLTIKEKEELVIFCLKNTKLKIILGISEANTEKAIEEVRYFSYLDIKAYLVMCPSVYLPSQVGLYHHFKEIADHSYKIPIIIIPIIPSPKPIFRFFTIFSPQRQALSKAERNTTPPLNDGKNITASILPDKNIFSLLYKQLKTPEIKAYFTKTLFEPQLIFSFLNPPLRKQAVK